MLLDLFLSTLFLLDIRFSEYHNSLCSDGAKVSIMSRDTGSTHDSYAFQSTQIFKEHKAFLGPNE